MNVILDRQIPRSLDVIIADLRERPKAGLLEFWLFEDTASRRIAEAALAAAGHTVRLRSAYKPLVHFFLEEVDVSTLADIQIGYPRHPSVYEDRFLLEAYPLAGMVGQANILFYPIERSDLTYEVQLTDHAGTVTRHSVFAPNISCEDHTGQQTLRCCGWRRDADDGIGQHLQTEFETLFMTAIEAVQAFDRGDSQPYFDRLRVRMEIHADDQRIDYCSENISFREAMHEDVFFSIRECLDSEVGAMSGNFNARPGQILPDILAAKDTARVVVTVETFSEATESHGDAIDLDQADRPLKIAQIRDELATIAGERFEARTREGRRVAGVYRQGTDPAVLITSGQHANETSGPVGALRAARELVRDPNAHFALVPVENVDGYELHQRLIVDNPLHMHHAARYTAMGDDLSFSSPEPQYERLARNQALALSGAELHLNLHGYPSHEWTRPMSGYLPRGFEMWTMPKGFFLIMCSQPGWSEAGNRLLDEISMGLAADAKLVAFNARQVECVLAHMPDAPFEMRNGIPCIHTENTYYQTPLTLITEAPDETVYGELFIDAHQAQLNTALLAVAAYKRLVAERNIV